MNKDFSYYLSKFLKDYLIIERNFSNNTVKSYKKSFQIFVDYLINIMNFKINNINFETITREIIINFLNYLEDDKHNSIQTRNQRLKAIKSFYNYCSLQEIENIDNIKKVLTLKFKKEPKSIVEYLSEDELKKLFDAIDVSTKIGRRDLVLLSLTYDTAARASEIINLKYEDINLESKYIILTGKGNKKRVVPIMEDTKSLLIKYFNEFNIEYNDYIFNNKGTKYSKNLLPKVCDKYSSIIPNKKLHPHIFRHTRAVHLLDHGVSILYIQELLGHESIIATQIYAKVIEKTKFKAIEQATPTYKNDNLPDWNSDKDLLSQLLDL